MQEGIAKMEGFKQENIEPSFTRSALNTMK